MPHTKYPPSSPALLKSRGGILRIKNAVRYSWQGLQAAYQHEAAFRQELVLLLLALPCAYGLASDLLQFTLLVASIVLILISELFNSALEALADAAHAEIHPLVARAKDMGSAAVMLCIVLAILVWLSVLVQRFFN